MSTNCETCGKEKIVKKMDGSLYCRSCFYKRFNSGRRDDVIDLLETTCPSHKVAYGVLTFIARQVDLSRERVRQIAESEGYLSSRDTYKESLNKTCKVCENSFVANRPDALCCSKECYRTYKFNKYWTGKTCKYQPCSKTIIFRKALIEIGREPVFCSKMCQGSYLGNVIRPRSKRRFHIAPRTREGLRRDLPDVFTARHLMEKYKYASMASCSTVVRSMMEKGLVDRVGGKGHARNPFLYRVRP